jgi:hypothetical protein
VTPLRLAFTGFWKGFEPTDNFITKLLDRNFEISTNPQIVFFSCFDLEHRKYPDSLKVFFTGENMRPNSLDCDHSISFELDERGGKNIRWPLYNLYSDPRFEPTVEQREKFCCMVVSNINCKHRLDFYHALAKYRKVDSGGRAFNNVGGPVKNKMDFLKAYKFCIAFENAYYPGYTTEKILEAKKAGCIPIYWGNPEIALDFNIESFVNAHAFRSFSQCIEYIAYLDRDEAAFSRMQMQPLLRDNSYTKYSDPQCLKAWLGEIMASRPKRGRWLSIIRPIQRVNEVKTKIVDWRGRAHFINDTNGLALKDRHIRK